MASNKGMVVTRQLLVLIVSTVTLVPYAVHAQEATANKVAQTKSNEVYVKILMPTAPVNRDKDRTAVESWIAEDLKKRGQAKFFAVTQWVRLDLTPFEATDVWDGNLGDKQSYCPVFTDIPERANGRIKVILRGWGPGGTDVTASMADEPGSRAIVAVKEHKTENGMPFVAVFIGPPLDKHTAQTDIKK